MKKSFSFILFLCFYSSFSQVGIGTRSPDSSAVLDVVSTEKGFLPPRIALQSLTDEITIANPAEGLVVYNTNTIAPCLLPGPYVFNGTQWKFLLPEQSAGNTPVANIVRDAAPGYGGYTGSGASAVPPMGVIVSNINSNFRSIGRSPKQLFDGDLANLGGETYHGFRNAGTVEDWGLGLRFDKRIRFTSVDLNGRNQGANQDVTNRIVNIVVQIFNCGELVHTSAPIAAPASTDSNLVSIPNVVGDEVRIVIPNGADTGGTSQNIINFDELIISGEL